MSDFNRFLEVLVNINECSASYGTVVCGSPLRHHEWHGYDFAMENFETFSIFNVSERN